MVMMMMMIKVNVELVVMKEGTEQSNRLGEEKNRIGVN
jgi:hypothetical protein